MEIQKKNTCAAMRRDRISPPVRRKYALSKLSQSQKNKLKIGAAAIVFWSTACGWLYLDTEAIRHAQPLRERLERALAEEEIGIKADFDAYSACSSLKDQDASYVSCLCNELPKARTAIGAVVLVSLADRRLEGVLASSDLRDAARQAVRNGRDQLAWRARLDATVAKKVEAAHNASLYLKTTQGRLDLGVGESGWILSALDAQEFSLIAKERVANGKG